eukprot:4350388-Ditylum_brightwellii.AAC.1
MGELKEWRNSPEGKASMEESKHRYKSGGGYKGGSGGKVHFTDKAIAAAVEKKLATKDKAAEDDKKKKDEVEGYIMSCIHHLVGAGDNSRPTPAAANTSSAKASVQVLKSIIERAKNNKY